MQEHDERTHEQSHPIESWWQAPDERSSPAADAVALARYRDLFMQMAEGVLIQDAEGRVIDANPAALHLLGLSMAQLLGHTAMDLRWRAIHLDGTEYQEDEYPAVVARRTGQAVRDAILGVFIPGEERHRWLRVTAAPRTVPGRDRPVGIYVTFDDITGWDRLEDSAHVHEARYQALMDQAADAVFVADLAGRYIEVNPAACTLLGYPREELLGTRIIDVIPHEDEPRLDTVMREELLQGKTHRGEWQLRRKDGTLVPVELSARMLSDQRLLAIVRDISERQRLERELAIRAQQLESLFETDVDAVMLFDATGRTIRMNAAQRRLLGYDAVGYQGAITDPQERVRLFVPRDAHGQPLPKEAWPLSRVLRGERLTGPRAVEMQMRAVDGRALWVNVSGAPIVDQNGRIVGGMTATRDVTVQRQLEQQRMDILQVVAHDLASPLAAISMHLHTLERHARRGEPLPAPDPDLLATLEGAAERMRRLVKDMQVALGLAANQLPLTSRPFDLAALCKREARTMEVATGRKIQVILPQGAVMVRADAERIGQVLTNLLTNADKYTSPERPITLTLRRQHAMSASTETAAAAGPVDEAQQGMGIKIFQEAVVLVQDTGPGIAPIEQERIWERFHRAAGTQPRPGAGGSLGLGLYISRAIIARHGGAMGVESTPGQGSTFWFTLPIAARA
ncbi:MAG TPA: PAS domain S-box protein [Ktedonobacterales bacterium]|jgi:PAS domain S-box-containing protein|nr:PAS domain S-box protein [Ktedonobacterales bacterium]